MRQIKWADIFREIVALKVLRAVNFGFYCFMHRCGFGVCVFVSVYSASVYLHFSVKL